MMCLALKVLRIFAILSNKSSTLVISAIAPNGFIVLSFVYDCRVLDARPLRRTAFFANLMALFCAARLYVHVVQTRLRRV